MIGKFSNFAGPLSSILSQTQEIIASPNLILSLDSGLTSSLSLDTGSILFDSSKETYLESTSNDFKFGTNDFTLEMWFYQNKKTPAVEMGLISNQSVGVDSTGVRLYIDNSNYLTFLVYEEGNGSTFAYTYHPTPVTEEVWHHVALVRKETTLTVYLDGDGKSLTKTIANLNSVNNSNLVIGKSFNNTPQQYFDGKITNVRVSNSSVYAANFNVSTNQLQSNGNTSLLILGIDESSFYEDSNTDDVSKTIINHDTVFNPETPITTIYKYTKTWKDISGSNYNFQFVKNTTLVNQFGNSIYFDGANYATGPDFGNLNRYTLDVWINFNNIVPTADIFTNIWDNNPKNINMFLGNFWSAPYQVWGGSYDGSNNFKSPNGYNTTLTSSWYNFVITFDKNSNVTMYVNGETHSTTNVAPYKPISSGLGYRIGRKWADDEFPVPTIDANLSIINVWDGALTYSTINSNYNSLLDRFYFTFHLDNYDTFDASASVIYDLKSNLLGTASGVTYIDSNNGCLLFGETASINFGNPESLNQNGDISIFTWVKFTDFNTAYNVIVDHFGPSPNDIFFTIKPDNSYTNWYMNLYTQFDYGVPGNEYGGLYDTTPIQLDTWYHLGFTLKNGGDLTFFVNGATSSVFNSINRNKCDLDFIIGSSEINNGLRGYLGELKLYNRVLSLNEVTNLYDNNYYRYNPYYGSMTFTGASSSHLTSNSLMYHVGSLDFTVETWFKASNTNGYTGIFSSREFAGTSGWSINLHDGKVEFYTLGGWNEIPINVDTWYHAAISRIGGTSSCYLNGVLIFEFADNNSYLSESIAIGRYYTNYDGYYFNGLISQPRLIFSGVGGGIYSNNFIASSTYSVDPNTVFLISKGNNTGFEIENGASITKNNIGFTSSLAETIVLDNLIVCLDANYPTINGSTWSSLVGSIDTTLYNSPSSTPYNFGNLNYLSFDDVSLQYASIPDLGNLPEWTVEIWFRLTKTPNSVGTCLITNKYNGATSLNFSIGMNSVPFYTNIGVGFFDGNWHSTAGIIPTLGDWYHFVGTYDGSVITHYINGEATGGTVNYVGNPTSGGEIRIMRRWDLPLQSENLMTGDVSIVRIYDRALSLNEVSTNYNYDVNKFI